MQRKRTVFIINEFLADASDYELIQVLGAVVSIRESAIADVTRVPDPKPNPTLAPGVPMHIACRLCPPGQQEPEEKP